MTSMTSRNLYLSLAAIALTSAVPTAAWAVPPTARVVSASPSNPLLAHDTVTGKTLTLKGVSDSEGANFQYTWDPGCGGAPTVGTVTNKYVIEKVHTYTFPGGTTFPQFCTASLTVKNTSTNEQSSATFPVRISQAPNLTAEVNRAIEEGLWYLHKQMVRSGSSGNWNDCAGLPGCDSAESVNALNVNAFLVNGFNENGSPTEPYTETVSRAMLRVFEGLQETAISDQTNDYGTFSPDKNSNGIGVMAVGGNDLYQGGSFIDAIVATNEPTRVVVSGPLANGTRTYADVVQDMADYYSFCQTETDPNGFFGPTPGGGWQYSCNSGNDNSAAQWAAIGLIPAERNYGAVIDPSVHQMNREHWLVASHNASNGQFGYTDSNPIWGPFATTPAGMVQMAMNRTGRGFPMWDRAESFMRDSFNSTCCDASSDPRRYYYGMFSFTKSMLLHDNSQNDPMNPGAGPSPLGTLVSQTPGVTPLNWYEAQTAAFGGTDPVNGVARTLVEDQDPAGYWYAHDYTSDQYFMDTAMAIIMLRRTVFEALPIACATATPNPIASGATVLFSATCSFHQDPNRQIVKYEWDFGSGFQQFAPTPAQVSRVINQAPVSVFTAKLRVTDNNTPPRTAQTTVAVDVKFAPLPPTANAGGPYSFCPNRDLAGNLIYAPWYLDASASSDPDAGKEENPAQPAKIVNYYWDFTCNNPSSTSPSGAQVRVDQGQYSFAGMIGQQFNVCLKVIDNDNLSFPSAGLSAGNSASAQAEVRIRQLTDPQCNHCVSTLQSLPKAGAPGRPTNVQLYWTDSDSAAFPIHHYNVFRSSNANFSGAVQIAGPGAASPSVLVGRLQSPAKPYNSTLFFQDNGVVSGQTYYYQITPATVNNAPTCNSNLTFQVVVPVAR